MSESDLSGDEMQQAFEMSYSGRKRKVYDYQDVESSDEEDDGGVVDLLSSDEEEQKAKDDEVFQQELVKFIALCRKKGLLLSLNALKAEFGKRGKNPVSNTNVINKKKKKKNMAKKKNTAACVPPKAWFKDEKILALHDVFFGDEDHEAYIEDYCEEIKDIGTLEVGDMLVFIGDLGRIKEDASSDEEEEAEEEEEEDEEDDKKKKRVVHKFVGVKSIIIGFTKPASYSRSARPANMILFDPHSDVSSKVTFKSNIVMKNYFKSKMNVEDFVGENVDFENMIRRAQKKVIIGAVEDPFEGERKEVFTIFE